jgi:hypothetical protein
MQKRALIKSLVGLAQGAIIAGSFLLAQDVPPEKVLLDESDTITNWSGITAVAKPVHAGISAAKWEGAGLGKGIITKNLDIVIDGSETLSFWIHSNKANDDEFMIVFTCPGPNDKGDYFFRKVLVDWEGWKEIRAPLKAFAKAREADWSKLKSLSLHASGWKIPVKADSEWIIDDLRIIPVSAK